MEEYVKCTDLAHVNTLKSGILSIFSNFAAIKYILFYRRLFKLDNMVQKVREAYSAPSPFLDLWFT